MIYYISLCDIRWEALFSSDFGASFLVVVLEGSDKGVDFEATGLASISLVLEAPGVVLGVGEGDEDGFKSS